MNLPTMTLQQALFYTKNCWGWLAKHPEKEKEDWPGFKKFGHVKIKNHCFCCHYAYTVLGKDCRSCPILGVWGGRNCECPESPWTLWINTRGVDRESRRTQRACAIKIYSFAYRAYENERLGVRRWGQ